MIGATVISPGAMVVMACSDCKDVDRVFRVGRYSDVYAAYMARCDVCKSESWLRPEMVDEAKSAYRAYMEAKVSEPTPVEKDEENKMVAKHKPKEPVVASSVEATLAQRGTRYGDFSDHARLCQRIKTAMMTHTNKDSSRGWDRLSDVQRQALDVIADKIARILTGDPDYDDNWHDIQGYAKLVEDRLKKETN